MDILNKILFLLFFLSCLNVIRHTFYILRGVKKSDEEVANKYVLTKKELFLLGLSIAYILTCVFTGITL
jgi:ABC-type proline/glycine betaine transport system permease subunit